MIISSLVFSTAVYILTVLFLKYTKSVINFIKFLGCGHNIAADVIYLEAFLSFLNETATSFYGSYYDE